MLSLSRNGLRAALSLASLAAVLAAGPAAAQDYRPPAGYYAAAAGLGGTALKDALHDAISPHTNLGYDAMKIAPRVLDADPSIPGNILLIYSGISITGGNWNREHMWPQSYGADVTTNPIPGADFHHLFPADPGVNSARSNLIFDWTDPSNYNTVPNAPGSSYDSNSFEPRDADKGRVARALFYMDLRYETSDGTGDFQLAEAASTTSKRMAKLSTLIQWNRLFAPDTRERRRNHLIGEGFQISTFTYKQGNRNPFVDFPELVDVLFTAGERIAYGTWRWTHFTMDQLQDGAVTGETDDPDGDRVVNVLEYAFNQSPVAAQSQRLMSELRFPGFSVQLRYTRQKAAEKEGVAYEIQRSATPLRAETWAALAPAEITSTSVTATGLTELVTLNLPDTPQRRYFRVKFSRTTGAGTTTFTYDPVRTHDPSPSIFVYDALVANSEYKQSAWMGYVADAAWPWVYHERHGYLYMTATRDDQVWLFDSAFGWLYTGAGLYPYFYRPAQGDWLYFLSQTQYPNRWFHSSASGWIAEAALSLNPSNQ